MAASLFCVVVGCSSDESGVTTTNGTYVAPVADFDVTSDSALWYDGAYDPVTGVVIAQITPTPGDGGIVDGGLFDGGTLSSRLPRPLSGLFSAWRVIIPASCVPAMSIVDNDQDGIPASYNAAFNCANQTVGTRTVSVTSTVLVADADDSLKPSGFTVTFSNFTVSTSDSGVSRVRTLNGTASLTPTGVGSFQSATNLTIVFNFADPNGAASQGTYTQMGQGTYTADPSAGTDVFASGMVNLLGTGTLNRSFNGSQQSRTVTRSTNPQLHWNRSCRAQNPDSFGYDSGTLVYQDNQGSKVQLQFNGCGAPTATSN